MALLECRPKCGRAEKGPFRKELHCPSCWLELNSPNSRKLRQKAKGREPLPCIHLGDELPSSFNISRNISTAKRYFQCDKGHGPQCRCDGFCGPSCSDYSPESPEPEVKKPDPPKRHLAFHIMPRMANDVWRRALDQLRLRWNLFNGIKVIAVVQGDGLEPASEIEEYVRGWGAEILQAPNDARLREVVTWDGLMSKVFAAANPQDFVFYAHAKGVTREIASTCMTHRWASLQYSLGLDYWPEIEALLKRRAIVGSFKKNGIAFGPQYGRWHYSGTFFWANVGILKYKLGQVPMPEYVYGVEAWPGMAFDVPEGGCLFHEHPKSKLDLYNPHHWHQSVMPELRTWLMTNPRRNAVESRSGGGSNEVG